MGTELPEIRMRRADVLGQIVDHESLRCRNPCSQQNTVATGWAAAPRGDRADVFVVHPSLARGITLCVVCRNGGGVDRYVAVEHRTVSEAGVSSRNVGIWRELIIEEEPYQVWQCVEPDGFAKLQSPFWKAWNYVEYEYTRRQIIQQKSETYLIVGRVQLRP